MNHPNPVIQALDEAQLNLVAGRAICDDAIPMAFDQDSKLLEESELLHLSCSCQRRKLACPALALKEFPVPNRHVIGSVAT